MKHSNTVLAATLSLMIGDVVVALDDTYEPKASASDLAMATALVALHGGEIGKFDIWDDSMRTALASLAIDWPDTTEEVAPATLVSAQLVRVSL